MRVPWPRFPPAPGAGIAIECWAREKDFIYGNCIFRDYRDSRIRDCQDSGIRDYHQTSDLQSYQGSIFPSFFFSSFLEDSDLTQERLPFIFPRKIYS